MREIEEQAARAYRDRFGEEPELVASAPGRVNLIGEHTDYNEGFVFPCAIDRRVACAIGPAASGETGELYSADFDQIKPLDGKRQGSWADYPRGVVWATRETGADVSAFRAAFAGEVPRASGLSSSAAVEAATATALDALLGLGRTKKDLARLCQKAENEFVGVPSGIMDQYASLLCEAGSALLVDCRSLDAETVPLDLSAAGLALIVCDTRVQRGLAATGYAERRKTCEAAARTLGVKALRDAREGDLKRLSGDEFKRARHVVTEDARVLEAAEALRAGDFDGFGRLMYESHRSMRDDFEISTREIDAFVETAREAGATGARLTGAGFGGCAIAIAPTDRADDLEKKARETFARHGFEEPDFYRFVPAEGAGVAVT